MNEMLASLDLNGQVLFAQIINIALLVIAFKYLIGDYVVKQIHEKRNLIAKLENADKHYEEMIDKANQEKTALLKEGKERKTALIAEASAIGEKRKEELILEGTHKAEKILEDAKHKAEHMQASMDKEFESAVKTVATATVTKLFEQDKNLKDEYLQQLVQDINK